MGDSAQEAPPPHLALQATLVGRGTLNAQFATGILIACGTMFPRILVYCLVINPDLLPSLIWPVLVMTAAFGLYRDAIGGQSRSCGTPRAIASISRSAIPFCSRNVL